MKPHPFCIIALSLLPSLPATAVTRTWDDGGSDANFSTAANWSPDGVPANGDDLVFPAAAPNTVTNDLTGRTFGSLSFPAGTTVAGNAFTLTGGISTVTAAGPRVAVTIQPNITLGANQTFTCGGAGGLTFSGSVGFGSHTLTVTGGSTCIFNGLAASTTAGSRLIKTGTGLLRVGTSAIAVTSQPWDIGGGTLDVDGSLQTSVNLTAGKLTGAGLITGLNATGGDIEPDAGGLSVAGPLTLGGSSRCLFHITGPGAENALSCSGTSVTIQGGASLLVDAPGYTPVWDETFQLLTKSTAGSVSGTFSNAADNSEVPLGTTIGRAHYNGGNGNDLTVNIVSTTRTWDGGASVNDNWTEADNWTLNTAPHFGDVLVFPSGITSSDRGLDNDFSSDTTFRKLVFTGDDFTVRGSRYRLSHGITLGFSAGQANLDTDVALAQDQTFDFGTATLQPTDRVLHLDLADSIKTEGHTLLLSGTGTLDGTISGFGKIQVVSGAAVSLSANSDYIGETLIDAGAELFVVNRESALGSSAAGTVVGGTLFFSHPASALTRFHITEPIAILPGGNVSLRDADTIADTELAGGLELRGPGVMRLSFDAHGQMRIPTALTGTGSLQVETDLIMEGSAANSFTGSMTVSRGQTVLQKSAPGVLAVPCAALTVFGGFGTPVSVETQQDEQIADNCLVTVGREGVLRIGNSSSRTETIGALTLDAPAGGDESIVEGPENSLLIVRGNVTQTGPGAGHFGVLQYRVEGNPGIFEVNGSLHFSSGVRVSRSGSASIKKTGPGTLLTSVAEINVPLEIVQGTVRFDGSTTFPIVLNGGTVTGSGGTNGGITSVSGGGIVAPSSLAFSTTVFDTKNISWNAATTYRADIANTAPGSGHDRLVALGTVSLGNAVLQLTELPGFNIQVGGQVFPLLNDGTDAIIGTFAGLPGGAFIPISAANGGGGWTISYTGGDGNDVSLTRVVTPPAEVPPSVTSVTFGNPDVNGNRPVTIAGKGTQGASYKLESSVNLTQWTPEGASQTGAAGTGALSFTSSASPAVRLKQFWRFRKL